MPERCFKKVYLLLWLLFFQDSDVVYVPCSGLTGENLTKCCNEPLLRKWYNGPTLLDRIGKNYTNYAAGSKKLLSKFHGNCGTRIEFGCRFFAFMNGLSGIVDDSCFEVDLFFD